ncbi:hypothetical protein Tco_0154871 [Tanacetum coccineum]
MGYGVCRIALDAVLELVQTHSYNFLVKAIETSIDTIWLVQNGCSVHGLRSEDPDQHLKDFLKLVDSLDLDGANKERNAPAFIQVSPSLQSKSIGLNIFRLDPSPYGEDLTTAVLASILFHLGRTTQNYAMIILNVTNIINEKSLLRSMNSCFKDLIQKVPHYGIDFGESPKLLYHGHVPVTDELLTNRSDGKLHDKTPRRILGTIRGPRPFIDHEIKTNPMDFAKPVNAISLSQDVL